MKKILPVIALALVLSAVTACNKDDDGTITIAASSARITAFSLASNDSVLPGLDSVYFSINEHSLQIYNADSLPMGTRIDKLVPQITNNGASSIEIHEPRPGQADSIHDYLENSGDTINFANGPVKVRVVSLDGVTTAVYTIKVNVHTQPTDTLMWSRLERTSLPSRFSIVSEQHTVQMGDYYLCLTRYDKEFCIARATDPAGTWEYVTPNFGFSPKFTSFSATDDHAYILDTDNNLYESTDLTTWTATGQRWNYIYGCYNNTLFGNKLQNGKYTMVSYPATSEWPLGTDFPVSGASAPICYTPYMGTGDQMIIVGGRTAAGQVSNATWAFDGAGWSRISLRPLPYALENLTVVPYFVVKTSKNSWRTKRTSVLLAMCGRQQDGTLNDTVYVSRDFGMNWAKADSTMQIPGTIPARMNAQAFNHSSVLTEKPVAQSRTLRFVSVELPWEPALNTIPAAGNIIEPMATAPITEWDCPYIYLFGGQNEDETVTYNTLWRAVINRFTFKPLQ